MSFLPDPLLVLLGERGWLAAREVVRRVRCLPGGRLCAAALFGSRARGDARPDSDIDLLLLYDRLAPDRDPEASRAEGVAERVARETGVPVSVWVISLGDLRVGERTPMLVDALDDAIPFWPRDARLPRIRFTPADALFCARCLLDRVQEGSAEVARLRLRGRSEEAAERAREDLVRLCTALLLLEGRTRPRRGEAIRALWRLRPERRRDPALRWAEAGFRSLVHPPPPAAVAGAVHRLREEVRLAMDALREARELPWVAATAAASRGHDLRTGS